jgi:hypothetical protein
MKSKIIEGSIYFYCPGCEELHFVPVNEISKSPVLWKFNHTGGRDNTFDEPTLDPAVFVNKGKERQCHFSLISGVLNYSPECWHKLKGSLDEKNEPVANSVPLPEIPEAMLPKETPNPLGRPKAPKRALNA